MHPARPCATCERADPRLRGIIEVAIVYLVCAGLCAVPLSLVNGHVRPPPRCDGIHLLPLNTFDRVHSGQCTVQGVGGGLSLQSVHAENAWITKVEPSTTIRCKVPEAPQLLFIMKFARRKPCTPSFKPEVLKPISEWRYPLDSSRGLLDELSFPGHGRGEICHAAGRQG